MWQDFSAFDFFRRKFVYSKGLMALIGVISILVALGVWSFSKNYYDTLMQEKFESSVSENLDEIQKRVESYKKILQSGIGFFYGSQNVSRQEWHDFVEALNIKQNYPGMQGIGYSVMLSPNEVRPIEEKMRKEGYSSFLLKPAGPREQYSAILYLEPLDIRNKQAIGYDMFSESVRKEAMEKARDTGLPAISGKVTLVQEIDSDVQAGMLMYLPLYKKGVKTGTVEQKREALQGFVYSAFRMNDLMNKLVLERSILNFTVYDSNTINDEHLLFKSFQKLSYKPKFHIEKTLQIENRTWHIFFSSTKKFDSSIDNTYPIYATLAGLTLYFIFLSIILTLLKGKYLLVTQAQELKKLSYAIQQSPNSILITNNEGEIEYINDAYIRSTNYKQEDVLKRNLSVLRTSLVNTQVCEEMLSALKKGQTWIGEFFYEKESGREHVEAIKASPIYTNGAITHYMIIKEDITEKKNIEKRVYHLANFDSLTSLPNRFQFHEIIDHSISIAKRDKEKFAIIFLDLDRFKEINDTLGHSMGDMLLVHMAKRLRKILRDVDTVARLGGDEFVFLLPKTDEIGTQKVASKILEVVDKPVNINGYELTLTGSIGIAIYPQDGQDKEVLLKNADNAMYMAKKEGRNKYCFYTDAMEKLSARKLMLTNALNSAIKKNELYLVYQPQVSLKDSKVTGVEALLRWNHPEFGSISPAEFIPLAEESGLILSIGEWVLKTAIAQTKRWQEEFGFEFVTAVNISAAQFRNVNLTDMVNDILKTNGLKAQYLELELTEAVAMKSQNIMNGFLQYGIGVAIDDFGTGYSSLSYIKKLKVSKLKIDQSFVRDIISDPEDKAIVAAIINMANSLGIKTIAEGVETVEQLKYLRTQGCDEVQGYYYSEPLVAEELEKFIRYNQNVCYLSNGMMIQNEQREEV